MTPPESQDTRTDLSPPDSSPSITPFVLGPFATNSYIVRMPRRPGCWIIDPSFQPTPLIQHINAQGLTPQAILLTHAHVDHIAGIDAVLRAFPKVPVHLHEAETAWLSDPLLNLSAMGEMPVTVHGPDRTLKDGDTLTLEGSTWDVLFTPGHSPGGVTFSHAPSRTAIVGDTLFSGSIGRTDFPGGDFNTLARSIRARLYTLPGATIIYPGHGPDSTIAAEMRTNPYVRGQ